jgi:glycerol-3-phosphate cytidylyltransferase-like family protein
MLEALSCVDLVVKNVGDEDSKPAIEIVMPDIVAIGEDWKTRDYYAQMGFTKEWLQERKIEVWYLPLMGDISSTKIRRSLAAVP